MNTPESPRKSAPVSLSSKLIYGLGAGNDMWGNWFYLSFVWVVFNQFLGVPGTVISSALAVRMGWDAITDPVFGWLSDNARTRFGRRRPFILVGSLLMGFSFPFLFTVGTDWSNTGYFWYMLASSVVFMTFVSCFNMPYQSLGAELSPDYDERNSVFKFKGSIQKVLEIAGFAAGAFSTALIWENATWADVPGNLATLFSNAFAWSASLIGSLFTLNFSEAYELIKTPFGLETGTGDENVNVLLGAQVYTSMLGVAMILIGLLLFFGLRERYFDKLVSKKQEQIKITASLGQALKCRPFRNQLAMALAYSLGLSMVGILGMYTTVYYVAGGNKTEGYLWNFAMGLSMAAFGFLGPLFFGLLTRYFDKRFTLIVVQLISLVVFVATWWLYTPETPWLQLFASGGIAFTQAGFWMMYSSIGADVIDYDELENGTRREGAFSACGSYIMKFGFLISMFTSGVILDATGFDAGLDGPQSDGTIFWMRFLLAAVPVVGILISLVAIFNFPLSKAKMQDVRAQLEERRGAV